MSQDPYDFDDLWNDALRSLAVGAAGSSQLNCRPDDHTTPRQAVAPGPITHQTSPSQTVSAPSLALHPSRNLPPDYREVDYQRSLPEFAAAYTPTLQPSMSSPTMQTNYTDFLTNTNQSNPFETAANIYSEFFSTPWTQSQGSWNLSGAASLSTSTVPKSDPPNFPTLAPAPTKTEPVSPEAIMTDLRSKLPKAQKTPRNDIQKAVRGEDGLLYRPVCVRCSRGPRRPKCDWTTSGNTDTSTICSNCRRKGVTEPWDCEKSLRKRKK